VKRFLIPILALGALSFAGCSDEAHVTSTAPAASDAESGLSATELQRLAQADEATWDQSEELTAEQLGGADSSDQLGDGLAKGWRHFGYDAHAGVAWGSRSYEITVENLTPATGPGASQPLSPPVFATHRRGFRMYQVGRFASDALAEIAEDAQAGDMVSMFESSRAVKDYGVGGGAIAPGASTSFTIETSVFARRFSFAAMLVNTNDGFTGVDSILLPRHGSREMMLYAYDAGSEVNTELASDIPGPCCGSPGVGTDSHEPIHRHQGIRGDADLDPAIYGWDGPVAKLTIRRLEPTYTVRVENLTPATGPGASQVFSPPVLATHARGVHVFRLGHLASEAMAGIAEDALNDPMVDWLENSSQVMDVQVGGGVIPPGAADEYMVEGAPGFRRLSLAFMLVNTNDGFSGVDSFFLPRGGQWTRTFLAYDAGSEKNTELTSDIPGPCCGSHGVRVPTHERIRPHRGILGVGDLDPDVYGWKGPVLKLTVTRTR
jgi:hypothetical protein